MTREEGDLGRLSTLDRLDVVSRKGAKLAGERGSTQEPTIVTLDGDCEQIAILQLKLVHLLRLVGVEHAVDAWFGQAEAFHTCARLPTRIWRPPNLVNRRTIASGWLRARAAEVNHRVSGGGNARPGGQVNPAELLDWCGTCWQLRHAGHWSQRHGTSAGAS